MALDTTCTQSVAELRATFASHKTKSYEWRMTQLQGVLRMLTQFEKEFENALISDLGKPQFEASLFEVVVCQTECRRFLANLKRWMSPTHGTAKRGHCLHRQIGLTLFFPV